MHRLSRAGSGQRTWDARAACVVSAYALVVGFGGTSEYRQQLRARFASHGLHSLFLDRWDEWHISLFPNSASYQLRSVGGLPTVRAPDVRVVLLFGYPSPPEVDAADTYYQAVEYEALLFGLCALATPVTASRWQFLAMGYSDSRQRVGMGHDVLQLWPSVTGLFELGAREALLFGDGCIYLTAERQVVCPSIWPWSPQIPFPVTLELDVARSEFVPLVGMLPDWTPPSSTILQAIIAASLGGQHSWRSIVETPIPRMMPAGVGRIGIVAHRTDQTAIHLLHRCRIQGKRSTLLDLTFLYSRSCPTAVFEESLEQLHHEPLVFARPLLVIRAGDPNNTLAPERHMRVLRTLQQRFLPTMNPPAAGHTNFSKSAHAACLVEQGLDVPATLATNDAAAARDFLAEYRHVIYKSGSWMRSLAAVLRRDDVDRLESLHNCPCLFQERIVGPSCRVHTVFDEQMSLLINIPGVDYRPRVSAHHCRPIELPAPLSRSLSAAAMAAGLALSGCDVIWSPDSKKWLTLEINRMPAFAFYDHLSSMSVADAVLDHV